MYVINDFSPHASMGPHMREFVRVVYVVVQLIFMLIWVLAYIVGLLSYR